MKALAAWAYVSCMMIDEGSRCMGLCILHDDRLRIHLWFQGPSGEDGLPGLPGQKGEAAIAIPGQPGNCYNCNNEHSFSLLFNVIGTLFECVQKKCK